MRSTRLLSLLLALVLPFAAHALTNDDIVKMHQAGLSDDTILVAIKPDTAHFDTSPDALIALKTAGISEAIIRKIITPGGESAREPAPAVPEAPATPSVFFDPMPSIAPAFVTPVVGQTYYTRFTFRDEGDKYVATNYARGTVVPINTAVTVVSMSGDKMRLKLNDSGRTITVENQKKYTLKSLPEFARLMLAKEMTPLDKLPPEVAQAVRDGELHKGMTKELALMTRGYPPAHETPSTEGNRWVYWSSRFIKVTVLFADGRLTEGRGIP